jgi:hypothetical protein
VAKIIFWGHKVQSPSQISSKTFSNIQLRRFNGTRAVKMTLDELDNPGGSLEIWLCVDNVLLVKHVQELNNDSVENDADCSTDFRASSLRNFC